MTHTTACPAGLSGITVRWPQGTPPPPAPADAHPSAHKSVLESANPRMDSGVHRDAPSQRHGQQPRLRDGRPPE